MNWIGLKLKPLNSNNAIGNAYYILILNAVAVLTLYLEGDRQNSPSFFMASSVGIQDLVDCFDDIPDLMKTMHKLTKSCPSTHTGYLMCVVEK